MYRATVNNSQQFEIDKNDQTLMNHSKVDFDIKPLPNGNYHVLLNNKSFELSEIEVIRNDKTVAMTINHKRYVVAIEDNFDLLLKSMGMDKSTTQKVSEVKSPMPGLVLNIMVEVGEEIKKDQPLMVLEAMKMENVIASPCDAMVASIEVKTQQKVDKNAVLVKFS
ncbi:MAG: acetyl-CoA carboxylase biotin carboxyl carrier protein subunit [Flavobacteriales bacterium]|nr:acetyl-CoA carboxylase biotin carboxyl carrier protein subunit [Flavobacteriales bacterium]